MMMVTNIDTYTRISEQQWTNATQANVQLPSFYNHLLVVLYVATEINNFSERLVLMWVEGFQAVT